MEDPREQKLIDIDKLITDIGIDNHRVRHKLLNMIHLASSTEKRKISIGGDVWSGVLPYDYVAGPLNPSSRVHIWGPPSSGKTALALNIASQTACCGGKILLIDTTFAANKNYITKLSGDFSIVQTAEIAPVIPAVGEYNIIILDDFACVTDPGSVIQLMSSCGITETILIVCNQIRANMKGGYYARRPGLQGMMTMSIYMKRVEKREKYSISQLKLERYRGKGTKEGRIATLPMDYDGNILNNKIVETLLPLAMMDNPATNTKDIEIVEKWIKKQWQKD